MTYLEHSKFVQSFLTIPQIQELWNQQTNLFQRTSNEATIRRWMNNGPTTKNKNFEGWIISISKAIRMAGGIKDPDPLSLSVDEKIDRLLSSADISAKERALIKGMNAFKEDFPLSVGQERIVDKIYNRRIG